MEPTTREIDIIYTTIQEIWITPNSWLYKMENIPATFGHPIEDHPDLKPGDRVKITITKEPDIAPDRKD